MQACFLLIGAKHVDVEKIMHDVAKLFYASCYHHTRIFVNVLPSAKCDHTRTFVATHKRTTIALPVSQYIQNFTCSLPSHIRAEENTATRPKLAPKANGTWSTYLHVNTRL